MSALSQLPTLADLQATRRAPGKGIPRVLAKEQQRKTTAQHHAAFRRAVWLRDSARSRATGKPLVRSGTDPHTVGEVHHVIPRSLAPARVLDVENGILLSRYEHQLAETACPQDPAHRLLEIRGPADRGQPQTFTWRTARGRVTNSRIG